MTDNMPDLHSHSGEILKSAREEKSLSIEQVAESLHLRPSVVKSIEEEQFDMFSSDVFLKGYYRTYCRLLELDEVKMMSVLDQQIAHRQAQVECEENDAYKKKQNKKIKKILKILFAFFVLVSIVLGLYAYFTKLDSSDSSQVEQPITEDVIESVQTQSENDTEAASAKDGLIQLNSEQKDLSSTEEDEIDSRIDSRALTEKDEVLESSPIISDLAQTKENETLEEEFEKPSELESSETDAQLPESQAEIETDINYPLLSIKAEFTGDCWFKLTDATGKTLVAALKRDGNLVNIKGKSPFHLVIGDASVVTLYSNDNRVDLKPFTSRNGRAELTLTP